jgi:hypothetical protein
MKNIVDQLLLLVEQKYVKENHQSNSYEIDIDKPSVTPEDLFFD